MFYPHIIDHNKSLVFLTIILGLFSFGGEIMSRGKVYLAIQSSVYILGCLHIRQDKHLERRLFWCLLDLSVLCYKMQLGV